LLAVRSSGATQKPSLLAVDGGMHPLDDSVDSGPSHYKGVMLEDTVDVEALRFMKAEWGFFLTRKKGHSKQTELSLTTQALKS
jgi:hypothetical protein